jgi:hypothetical protein
MNAVLRELFPHLKLKDKNLTLFNKVYIYSSIVAQLFAVIWVCLYFFLPKLYNFTQEYNNITIHSNTKTTSSLDAYLKESIDYLKKDALYNKDMQIDIFFLNDSLIYTLLNPIEWLPNRQTYAVTQNSRIYIKNVDLKDKIVYVKNKNNYPENLNSLFIHEALHAYQNKKYGWLYTSFIVPYWVKEGYPIYRAKLFSKYKNKELIEYMQKAKDTHIKNWSIFAQDQFYALLVKHAIEKMHKSVDDLHLGKVDYDEVFDSLLKEYNITK